MGPAPGASAEAAYAGKYLSRERVDLLLRARAMKDRKIDEILKSYADGQTTLEACDDVVSFLKMDIGVIDSILNIDFTDRSSVVAGFKDIVATLKSSDFQKNQDLYVASLTQEESFLEYSYAQVIQSLQGMMMYMRDDLV